ncbi:hypothetical protein AUK22_12000 [bacterium CG2_30_54_10]|nr:MAG: hypothetical protein AUK22_12000 [bacterium CG2_30_54_10]
MNNSGGSSRLAIFTLILASLTMGTPVWASEGIQTPFTIWMMNNEARVLSILAADRRLMDTMSMGNGMLLTPRPAWPRPENRFWRLHLRYFATLNEINQVFQMAQRFGTGQLAKTISSVQPGEWATLGFLGLPACRGRGIAMALNDFCKEAYLNVLGLEKGRDSDLGRRLRASVGKLSDSERRLLSQYFGNFLALYPKNVATRTLLSFLKNGLKKNLSKGVAALFSAKPATAPDDSAGLLLELEETAPTIGSETAETAVVNAEAPPDGTATPTESTASQPVEAGGPEADPFNIWDGDKQPSEKGE